MLEASKHHQSSMVTLTYSSEHLPANASLSPVDLKLWLKRLRKVTGKLRYFAVGEYGDQTHRPHYHVIVFGHDLGQCSVCDKQFHRKSCNCSLIKTWGKGLVHCGEVNELSAGYVSGYVVKKMTKKDDERLNGRYPEFCRMSLKPGIGASAMTDVANALNSMIGQQEIINKGDVPDVLLRGGKKHPLGRYLRERLRKEIGLDSEMLKKERLTRWSVEIAEFLKERIESSTPVKQIFIKEKAQQALKQEYRMNLFKRRRSI